MIRLLPLLAAAGLLAGPAYAQKFLSVGSENTRQTVGALLAIEETATEAPDTEAAVTSDAEAPIEAADPEAGETADAEPAATPDASADPATETADGAAPEADPAESEVARPAGVIAPPPGVPAFRRVAAPGSVIQDGAAEPGLATLTLDQQALAEDVIEEEEEPFTLPTPDCGEGRVWSTALETCQDA
jgi:hypothetical protein